MSDSRYERNSGLYYALVGLVIALLVLGVVPTLFRTQMASNERCAGAALRTVATAQQDFRDNDRDGDGRKEFWRTDIAGLYGLEGRDGAPIGLIDEGLARADARPATTLPSPARKEACIGYHFAALRFANEQDEANPARFAACAFPKEYGSTGKLTFIISHTDDVYRKDLGHGNGLEIYPADPVGDGWEPRD